ncbi:uncharacterized protein MELLADRAFT_114219 [Melampsora larici-populina 98AG31]|uniref:Uncharacterized protein n=1 Tax=Melampsora larici-populina (strain 98AG31 / pathotype 3-4-7) TaxID=747676 RepID=F4SCN5_MELLP|nr:uncharacterized protein MELLADRAFT_114219 [Melampsora larici-populina 98AG31]EGF97589.1 hypothetical protein MELLADRAFT_114219 [Melampsora larici-populina 98AG31]
MTLIRTYFTGFTSDSSDRKQPEHLSPDESAGTTTDLSSQVLYVGAISSGPICPKSFTYKSSNWSPKDKGQSHLVSSAPQLFNATILTLCPLIQSTHPDVLEMSVEISHMFFIALQEVL